MPSMRRLHHPVRSGCPTGCACGRRRAEDRPWLQYFAVLPNYGMQQKEPYAIHGHPNRRPRPDDPALTCPKMARRPRSLVTWPLPLACLCSWPLPFALACVRASQVHALRSGLRRVRALGAARPLASGRDRSRHRVPPHLHLRRSAAGGPSDARARASPHVRHAAPQTLATAAAPLPVAHLILEPSCGQVGGGALRGRDEGGDLAD